ncbi:MAG: hypothetical protein PHV36_14490 [Elusimicrobiales bacterium]|nr:hypothetical protein [Elusimicrobiales bacterium]
MKLHPRVAVIAAAALFCLGAARTEAAGAAPGRPAGRLELFFEALDGQGWQLFFLADTVKRRLPAADLKVYPLVAKNADGSFSARRGEAELAESIRLAMLSQYYPGKILSYLSARSMSPAADGWRDAAVFAGINPDELERRAAADGQAALAAAGAVAARAGATATLLLLDGKPYEGSQRLLPLYEAVNAALPPERRAPPPAGYKPRPKVPPPGFWVVLSSGAKKNEALVGAFDRYFEGIKPSVLDYDSAERAGKFPRLDYAPAYIIAATPDARARLEKELQAGIFKEADGYLVYEDRQGRGFYASRAVKENTLELFVMSECPFGVSAENAVLAAEKDGLLPPGLKLEIHFIGDAKKSTSSVAGSGWEFSSLHGEPEWRENARQLFISGRFPDKFKAYLLERNKDIKSPDWEKAAKAVGIDAAAVTAGSGEAADMLAEDFAKTSALGITSSPTFVLGGREVMMGLGELAKTPGYEKLPAPGQTGAGCNK